MRLVFSAFRGEFRKEFFKMRLPIARAATLAIHEIADIGVREGQQELAASGFSSRRWQRGVQAHVFPPKRKKQFYTVKPAVTLSHKIGFAYVFEFGETLKGKPLMWLPLDSAKPLKAGGRRITPSWYVRNIGPLASVNVPGKKPMLVARADRGKKGTRKITLSALRRGAKGEGNAQSVPLFVGVPSVKIPKKFSLRNVWRRLSDRLGEFYLKHLRND